MRYLMRLLGRYSPVFDGPPPHPERLTYVVGDIHGRADLLVEMLGLISADFAAAPDEQRQLVFAGDYVDRGQASCELLIRLARLQEDDPERTVCLRGNHEAMMLEFLAAPAVHGSRWLINGGLQTLASYRIGGLTERSSPAALERAAEQLRTALAAEGIEDWLAALPLFWRSGSLVVAHAGADPGRPIEMQDERDLLWGHRDFLSRPRQDQLWVAFGHIVQDQPGMEDGRIAVDTGAVFTGRLTAAVIEPAGAVRFLSTGRDWCGLTGARN